MLLLYMKVVICMAPGSLLCIAVVSGVAVGLFMGVVCVAFVFGLGLLLELCSVALVGLVSWWVPVWGCISWCVWGLVLLLVFRLLLFVVVVGTEFGHVSSVCGLLCGCVSIELHLMWLCGCLVGGVWVCSWCWFDKRSTSGFVVWVHVCVFVSFCGFLV